MTNQRVAPSFFSAIFGLAVTAIVALALMPSPPNFGIGDKAEHAGAFACLSLLSLMAFPQQRPIRLALGLAGLGAVIELVQLSPALHRSSDAIDWLADCAAIALVFGVAKVLRRIAAVRV